jgi:hypothetical protein
MAPQELVELASQLAGKLFDIKGELRPVYMVETEDALNLMPPPPHLSKEDAIRLIKKIMKEIGATGYVFVDEAWIVEGDRSDLKIPPSEHPRRKEVVIFIAETDSETLLAQREIIRPPGGGKPTLGPLTIKTDYSAVRGRMMGMLREEETQH